MFRPETYACVQEHKTIGVTANHQARFREIADGDRFVAYVSRSRLLDAYGTVTGGVFEGQQRIFGDKSKNYLYRAPVAFTETGLARDGSKLLYGLSEFESGLTTSPGNFLFCKGGFLRITEADYDWLVGCMRGEIHPEWEHADAPAV